MSPRKVIRTNKGSSYPKLSLIQEEIISMKEVPRNSSLSICDKLDCDSNATEESDPHK
jgi:hypothetical protein